MNYIKHLAGFFDRVITDERLNPTHISMYVSLFQFWNACRFQNPISISRNELMKVSKICSKATYHKCMRELHDYGYLKYKPSYNPFKGSLVYLFNFQASDEQALVGERTKIETGIEQAQEPYINISKHNKQNVSNIHAHAKKNTNSKNELVLNSPLGVGGKKEKSSAKKERYHFVEPQIKNVKQYFSSKKYPDIEAQKFFKHYKSIGWLVGGKTTMADWKASADKWMINHEAFFKTKTVNPKAKHLHASTNKNYSEPL